MGKPSNNAEKEPLRIEIELKTDLIPILLPDRQGLKFHQEQKKLPVLSYDELHVFDARGAEIPAQFELIPSVNDTGHSKLAILVDDHEASYPIVVDPILNVEIVKDINQTTRGTGFDEWQWVVISDVIFFKASVDEYGWELWKSDGTEEGTVMVKDIRPGPDPSDPNGMTVMGDTLYFSAKDGIHGNELWTSDGTEAGTVMVKDINPGPDKSNPSYLTAVGTTLFFGADDGIVGKELWKSDGTEGGTVMVKDIFPGYNIGGPNLMKPVGATLFFAHSDGIHGGELWKSDGTEAGTVMVKDINTGDTYGGSSVGSFNTGYTAFGDFLYFNAYSEYSEPGQWEMWKTDGTAEGTVQVKKADGNTIFMYFWPSTGVVGTTLLFNGDDDELWKTDGTQDGTVLVKEINPLPFYGSGPTWFRTIGDTVFFTAWDGIHGRELWKTDGTEERTVLVKDINPDQMGCSNPVGFGIPSRLTVVGDLLFFTHYQPSTGQELWVSDGTEEGTYLVKDIDPVARACWDYVSEHQPKSLTAVGENLFFVYDSYEYGYELWKSDGTEAGTVLVKDITSNKTNSSAPYYAPVEVGGNLYFPADDGIHGDELWKSDGTEAGTVMVKDINTKPYLGSSPELLTRVGDTLFFAAENPEADIYAGNCQLWKSDGTEAGTVMLKDFNPLQIPNTWKYDYIESMWEVGDTLFLNAEDSSTGYGLWKSDGTEAGTVLVTDMEAEIIGIKGDTVFLRIDDGIHGYELWKSDGTEAGTVVVKDINPGSQSSIPYWATAVGDAVFFIANDGIHGYELWKSDGTEAGTMMVKDIRPGAIPSDPDRLTAVGATLFFTAVDEIHGKRLWKSDGTGLGTMMVKDTRPGYTYPLLQSLFAAGNTLFFVTDDGIHGGELWISDGTEAGTFLAADIDLTGGSFPRGFVNYNDRVFFWADDDSRGFELWTADIPPSVTISGPESGFLTPVGTPVVFTGTFDDAEADGPHTADWTFSSATGPEFTVPADIYGNSISGTISFSTPGIYAVRLTVFDGSGVSGKAETVNGDNPAYVVVYDPEGGFVTGGGWIASLAGAYKPDPLLAGKATFGFVSKYKKGATVPTGNTEFQFQAADLNFHSSSYEWLVVTGSNYAMFKGEGTINGYYADEYGNPYKFRVWAGDDEPDTFRIRIWTEEETTDVETDIYDNGSDQAIGGGSIVIHAK
jgi:ELWxxDGT repeat protein